MSASSSTERGAGTNRERDRSRLVRNSIAQYGLQLAKYIFPLITIPYLTRVLGSELYGVRSYILSVMTFGQTFIDFGFLMSITKSVVLSRSDKSEVNRIVSSAMLAKAGMCAAVFVVVICMIGLVPIMRENWVYALLAFLSIALNGLIPDFIFRGYEQMGILTNRFVVSKGVSVVLTFLFVRGPGDLLLVPAIDCVTSIIAFVWSWASAAQNYGIKLVRVSFHRVAKDMAESFIYFISIVSTSAFNQLSTIVIGILVASATDVAYWSLCVSIFMAIEGLYTPISNSLYPYMITKQDMSLAKQLLMRPLPILVILTIALAFFSPLVMKIVGGDAYVAGTSILIALSPVVFFSYYSIMLGWPTLGAAGEVKLLTCCSVASAVVLIIGLSALYYIGAFSVLSVAVLRSFVEFCNAAFRYVACKYKSII